MFLTKASTTNVPTVPLVKCEESEHLPVYFKITAGTPRNPESRKITVPRKQRKNPRYNCRTKTKYREEPPACLIEINNANTRNALETAYKMLKGVILEPWTEARRTLPKRYSLFWNGTLDAMAKRKKRLYRRYLTEHTTLAHDEYKEMDRRINRVAKQAKEKYHKHVLDKLAEGKGMSSYRHARKL